MGVPYYYSFEKTQCTGHSAPHGRPVFMRRLAYAPCEIQPDIPQCFRGCPGLYPLERWIRYDNFYNGFNTGMSTWRWLKPTRHTGRCWD